MSYKKARTGPDEMRTFTPSEEVEFCDVCGLEMPEGLYPRFELTTEYCEQPPYEDENWRSHHFSLCSVECVTNLAHRAEKEVSAFKGQRRRAADVEDVNEEKRTPLPTGSR